MSDSDTHRFEMITDSTGFPQVAIVVKTSDDGWLTTEGKPGFVEFVVVEVIATEMDGTPLYEKPDVVNPMNDPTTDIAEANEFASGSVKWDGCMNWSTNTETVLHHHCTSKGLATTLDAVKRAYAIACEMMGVEG